jgi:hemolysin activation/secretion protein
VIVPPEADISRQRVAPLPLPDPRFDLRILNPEKAAQPRAVDEIEFSIARIQVEGATVFTTADLAAIFKPLEGRRIVLENLRSAAEQLEGLYRSRGYFLTRVFVPPQTVRNDTLVVQVVEGHIGQVTATAPNTRSQTLAQKMIGPVVEKRPLRLVELESPLLLLNDMPGIRATSLIRAGAALGSSDLEVKVERRPTQSFVAVSNFSSDAIGPLTMTAGTAIAQPFGTAGLLDLSLSGAGETLQELQALNARYAAPVGNRGVVASIGFVVARAAPGGTIAALDVRSRTASVTGRLRLPLLRTRPHSLFLDGGLTLNRSRIKALDQTIVDDRGTTADLALHWRQVGWLGGDMTVRVAAVQGLVVLGANNRLAALPSVAGFRPNFRKLTYVLQRNQPLAGQLSAGIVVQGQASQSRLVSGEQIMFGGSFIGRGYDPSQIIGDSGIGGLAELRWSFRTDRGKDRLENLQLYVFGDMAEAQTNGVPGAPRTTTRLASLGVGLRALAFGRLALDGQIASARRTVSPLIKRGERLNLTATLLF